MGYQLLTALGVNAVVAVVLMQAIPAASFLPYSLYFGLGIALWAAKLRDPYVATAATVALTGVFMLRGAAIKKAAEPVR